MNACTVPSQESTIVYPQHSNAVELLDSVNRKVDSRGIRVGEVYFLETGLNFRGGFLWPFWLSTKIRSPKRLNSHFGKFYLITITYNIH